VTSVVNADDDGKSRGEIRRFLGMLGPSDTREVQELMLPQRDPVYAANLQLFRQRYPLDAGHDETIAKLSAFPKGRAPTLRTRASRRAGSQSQLKPSETYVEYDEEGYADIRAPRIVEAFESTSAPGRQDGVETVETMLDLYERSGSAAMRA
jgi:hypothetical protein